MDAAKTFKFVDEFFRHFIAGAVINFVFHLRSEPTLFFYVHFCGFGLHFCVYFCKFC